MCEERRAGLKQLVAAQLTADTDRRADVSLERAWLTSGLGTTCSRIIVSGISGHSPRDLHLRKRQWISGWRLTVGWGRAAAGWKGDTK